MRFQRAGVFEESHPFEQAVDRIERDLVFGMRSLMHQDQNEFPQFHRVIADLVHAGDLLANPVRQVLTRFHQLIQFRGGNERFLLTFRSLEFPIADPMQIEHPFGGGRKNVISPILKGRVGHDVLRLAEHPAKLSEEFFIRLGHIRSTDGTFRTELIQMLLP